MLVYFDKKKNCIIHVSLNNIQGSLTSHGNKCLNWNRVSSNEDNIHDLVKCVDTLEKENPCLKVRVDNAENRSRSLDLNFIHVPEKSEGCDVVGFMKQLILLLLGKKKFSSFPSH